MPWVTVPWPFSGFYCADTVSLSFGALSVNDVVAAALTVAFCELASVIYYSVRYRSFIIWRHLLELDVSCLAEPCSS